MAKRRKRKANMRSASRTFYKRVKRRARSKKPIGLMGTIMGAALYGAARPWLSAKIQLVARKLPFGALNDEVVLGTLVYLVAKGKVPMLNKVPLLRQIAKGGLLVEAASGGAYIGSRMLNKSVGNGSIGGLTVF